MSEPTDEQKALNYYKAGAMQGGRGPWPKPAYVPKRIMLTTFVCSDIPGEKFLLNAKSGTEHECESNPYGAVSININGEWLGVRLNEFTVLEWQENAAAKGEQHGNLE